MATKYDLAASISLDTKPLATSATEAQRELGLIDRAVETTTHHGQQLARVLGTVADVAIQSQATMASLRGIDRIISEPVATPRPVSAPPIAVEPPQLAATPVDRGDDGGISKTAVSLGLVAARSSAVRVAVGAAATEIGRSGLAAGLTAVGTQGLWLAGGVAAAGVALAGLAVGIPALIAAGEIADRQFDKFHGTIDSIATGAPLATAELAKLTTAAQEFSLESPRSFTELATLAGHVTETRKGLVTNSATTAVAGTTATDLAAASLPLVSNFETITGLQTGEAAKAQAALVAGFQQQGMSLQESIAWQHQLNDLIAVGANISGMGTDQLARSLMAIAPEAQAVGWGLRETTTAVTALAESGMSAAQIDKTLGPALSELRVIGLANRDAFAEMGVAVTDAEGRLQPVASIAGSVAVSMSDLNREQRAAQLQQLGMSEATATLVARLSTLGPALNDARDQLRGASGASEKLIDSLSNNYDAAWKKNTSSVNSLALSIGGLFKSAKEYALTPILEASGNAIGTVALDVQQYATSIHDAASFAYGRWKDLKELVSSPWVPQAAPIVDAPKPPPPPPKLDLPEWMTKASDIGETASKVRELGETQAKLDGLYAAGSYTAQEYANASRNIASALDDAQGGGQSKIASLTREIELLQLATDADRRRAELVFSGKTPEAVNEIMALEAQKAVVIELAALRERERKAGEGDSSRRKLVDLGANESQLALVDAQLAQTQAAEAAAKQEGDAKQRVLELQREIRKLQDIPEPKLVSSPEIEALESDRDQLKQRKDDAELAMRLADQYDPTKRITEQRDELERLRSEIGEVAYANGVKALDEQWQNATKSAREHREEINRGLTGAAAVDAIFARIALGDGALQGLPPGAKPQPVVKPGPAIAPPQPYTAPALAGMPKPQLAQSQDMAVWKDIADKLATVITKLDEMARSESGTERNTRDIADGLEIR